MTGKTETSDLSRKVHSYFSSLSLASSRILDDVKNISLASRRSHRSWNNLSEREKADIVLDSLVPDDVDQKYRSIDHELSPLGVPSSHLESLIDTSQAFPVIEITTNSKPKARSVVIEEDINGQKVPITWRDEHSVPFSWYNQSCDPIVAVPPPFVVVGGEESIESGPISLPEIREQTRLSRRSSRASTPERRRSPLMRPKQAPPPPPPKKVDSVDTRLQAEETDVKFDRKISASQESMTSQHSRPSSAGHKKRQAPKPPVSPTIPQVPERSSTLSLSSVGSNPERPRSTFSPATDPDQPHILPEALAPEPDPRSSPLLQPAKPKVPPQQLKKVCPPVAPKLELKPSFKETTPESIVTTPVMGENIPKTGFEFLDNW